MKTFKKFRTEQSLTSQTPLASDASIKNANRNAIPDLMKSISNPNDNSSRALPNLARPRSFDATPDRQSSLTRSHFNSNIGNKLGTRIDTTDNNKLQIK